MQPSHLCDFVCSKTSNSKPAGVVNVESGCACVVKIFVLDALGFKPCSKQATTSVKHAAGCCADSPKKNVPSAKPRSNKCDVRTVAQVPEFCLNIIQTFVSYLPHFGSQMLPNVF